jgi:hypothetical protein
MARDSFDDSIPSSGEAKSPDMQADRGRRHPAITAASLLFVILGAGWLVGSAYVVPYIAINRDLANMFGIPAGSGRIFDAFGLDMVIVALALLAVVQALGILAGVWLWRSRRRGAVLGTITMGHPIPLDIR